MSAVVTALGVLEPSAVPDAVPQDAVSREPGVLERGLAAVVDEFAGVRPGRCSPSRSSRAALVALRRSMDRQEAVFARWASAGHTVVWVGRRGARPRPGCPPPRRDARGRRQGRDRVRRVSRGARRDGCGVACRAGPDLARSAHRRGRGSTATTSATRVRGGVPRPRPGSARATEPAACDGPLPQPRPGRRLRTPLRPRDAPLAGRSTQRTVLSAEFGDLAAETVTNALHEYIDPPVRHIPRPLFGADAAVFVRICEVALATSAATGERPRPGDLVLDWQTVTGREARPVRRRVHRPDPPRRRPRGAV